MPKATLSGNIQAGPTEGTDSASLPSGTLTDALAFSSGEELSYAVSTGLMVRLLASGVLVTLYGVGVADAVTKAKLVYFRTNAAVDVRFTFQDASVATITTQGILLYEANPSNPITAISVKGTATVQYAAFGDM